MPFILSSNGDESTRFPNVERLDRRPTRCADRSGRSSGNNRTAQLSGGPESGFEFGAGDGVRTRDIQLGKLTLCQLSYSRSGARAHLNSAVPQAQPERGLHVLTGCECRPGVRGAASFEWS